MNASKYVEKVHKRGSSSPGTRCYENQLLFVCVHSMANRQIQLVSYVDFVTVLSIFRLQLH